MLNRIFAYRDYVPVLNNTARPAYQLLLLAGVIVSALSVVTSQHKSRKLYIELQKEKDRAQQMEVEWGQLQLEQSTWATPARVERIATQQLQMRLPQSGQIRYIRANPDGTTLKQ